MLVIFITAFCYQDKTPLILWNKKKLCWNDFKKTPDTVDLASKIRAATYSRLEQRYFITPEHKIHFTVLAWFNPDKSWVNPKTLNNPNTQISDLVLEHEQHHFDITELYARQVRESLSKIIFYDSTYRRDIPLLFKKYYEQYRAEQNKYDNEAGHSNFTKQYYWVKAIDNDMEKYAKYADTCVIVTIYLTLPFPPLVKVSDMSFTYVFVCKEVTC